MKLDIVSYEDLLDVTNITARKKLETSLLAKGIIGISNVPGYEAKCKAYINAARKFCALNETIKQQYAPNRDAGLTEGYELGAEWFKNQKGEWCIDDKKASFYAFVPDDIRNQWPQEINLKTSYLELGELIFATGKLLLNTMELNDHVKLEHHLLVGYGRMLHYHKENDATNENPNWCGAHFDHGVFTGLIPAYYFRDGIQVDEPEEAGLYIAPSDNSGMQKINATDKSILLFQVGEFGQLISNDRIKATKHMVKKAFGGIERYTFALFFSADDNTIIHSTSELTQDARYSQHQNEDGGTSYGKWQEASYARYRAR